MKKRHRLITLLVSLFILIIVGSYSSGITFLLDSPYFTSGLLLLILLSLVDQPFFSKDANIFLNAVTAFMSLLVIKNEWRDFIFWSFFGIIIYLLATSYVFMWIRDKKYSENVIIKFLSQINQIIGRPTCIFSVLFLWGAIKQLNSSSPQFNALLLFWVVFMLISAPQISLAISNIFANTRRKEEEYLIGEIVGVHSQKVFLVKLFEDRKPVKIFSFVGFAYSGDKIQRIGVVLDVYYLNNEQWIKVISLRKTTETNFIKLNRVYLSEASDADNEMVADLVGIITENSTIDKIKFIHNPQKIISDGQLVEISIGCDKVVYQITQGTTKIEQLEEKNESDYVLGEAVQLGIWNSKDRVFMKYGWVPNINSPLYTAKNIEKVSTTADELCIGEIPDTSYPVILNKETAVTHHTAIIGVTGTGKSFFARNLIRSIADENTKVIAVDFTGEYSQRISDIVKIINDESAKEIFNSIENWASEMAKFANQRSSETLSNCEDTIKKVFYRSIKAFIDGESNIALFELPDISNETNSIEYLKRFFWVLFNAAKANNSGKRICVVLEEAHTIIPEITFIGTTDGTSKAAINTISQIALQGRKYGIGFIVIAQRTANVSKTVLTQCNTIIAFQAIDKTTSDFLSNYISPNILEVLPSLKFRNAIAVGKAIRSTTPMIFEVPEITE